MWGGQVVAWRPLVALAAAVGIAAGAIALGAGPRAAADGPPAVAVERTRISQTADGLTVVMTALIDVSGGADADAVMDELAPGWADPAAPGAPGEVSAAYVSNGWA